MLRTIALAKGECTEYSAAAGWTFVGAITLRRRYNAELALAGDVVTSSPAGVALMAWVRHFDIALAVFPETGHMLYVAKFGECHVRLGVHRFRRGKFAVVGYRAADAPTARAAADWNNFVQIFTDAGGTPAPPAPPTPAASGAASAAERTPHTADGRDAPMKPPADVVQYAFDSLGPCSYNSLYDNCEVLLALHYFSPLSGLLVRVRVSRRAHLSAMYE